MQFLVVDQESREDPEHLSAGLSHSNQCCGISHRGFKSICDISNFSGIFMTIRCSRYYYADTRPHATGIHSACDLLTPPAK